MTSQKAEEEGFSAEEPSAEKREMPSTQKLGRNGGEKRNDILMRRGCAMETQICLYLC